MDSLQELSDRGCLPTLAMAEVGAHAAADPPNAHDPCCTHSLLAAIAEAIPDAVYVKDCSGKYLFCNRAATRQLQVSESLPVGGSASEYFDEADTHAIVNHDHHVMLSGEPETREVQLSIAGSQRTYLITKSPYRNADGATVGVIGIARDITEQKAAEATLRENERRLGDGEKLAHFGYWERDLLTDQNRWSDETYRIYGLVPQERNITLAESMAAVHSDDRQRVREIVTEIRESGKLLDIEYRIIRPDGEVRHVHSRGQVHFGESGQALTMFGVLQDVTDRKKAEESLRSQEFDLATAQRVARIGNWRLNVRDGAVTWSDELYRLLGVEKHKFSGTLDGVLECIHPQDHAHVLNVLEAATAENPYFELEYRVPFPGQPDRTIRAIGHVVVDSTGEVIELFGTAQDITEQKQIDAEREQLHQELLVSRKELEELSHRVIEAHENERRNIAHELHDEIGQVLTAVNLNLQSLRPFVRPEAASRLDDGMAIVSEAIRQVRDLSLNLWPASIELLGLEAALSAYLARESERAGIVTEFTSSLHGLRLPSRLEAICFRVVQGAVTNVLRHARATRCRVDVSLESSTIAIVVEDDGVGFDPAVAFDQIAKGRGFGLLGMQERVQLIAGEFKVESRAGHGTIVTALLPLSIGPGDGG